MKYCSKCGTELADSATFCSFCGAVCQPMKASVDEDMGTAILGNDEDMGTAILGNDEDMGTAILGNDEDMGTAILENGEDMGTAILKQDAIPSPVPEQKAETVPVQPLPPTPPESIGSFDNYTNQYVSVPPAQPQPQYPPQPPQYPLQQNPPAPIPNNYYIPQQADKKLSLFGAYANGFKKCFSVKGRARRSEFWKFHLANFMLVIIYGILVGIVLVIMDNAYIGDTEISSAVASVILGLYLIISTVIPPLTLTIRRLHDIGRSGWFVFIQLVPVVGSLVLLVMMFMDSEIGENKYGPNPKGVTMIR